MLRLLQQRYARAVDVALQEAGFADIRPPHANVFPFVPPQGIQIGALAAMVGVRKQSMAQSVMELEQAGYVERRPDPGDGRARLVFLTPKGRAVPPVAKKAGSRVEAEWSALLGEKEFENLRTALLHLRDRLGSRDISEP